MGPDFLQAFSLDDNESGWKLLYDRVRRRESNVERLSHAMPKQPDFTKSEAKALFSWVAKSRGLKFKPYNAGYLTDPAFQDSSPTPIAPPILTPTKPPK